MHGQAGTISWRTVGRSRWMHRPPCRLACRADERYELFLDGRHHRPRARARGTANWFYETYELNSARGSHLFSQPTWWIGSAGGTAGFADDRSAGVYLLPRARFKPNSVRAWPRGNAYGCRGINFCRWIRQSLGGRQARHSRRRDRTGMGSSGVAKGGRRLRLSGRARMVRGVTANSSGTNLVPASRDVAADA